MIKMIVAVSKNGIIGITDHSGTPKIPWHYSSDFKRFKQLTLNSTIIMGRKTWESIGKPLPKRRNIVISRTLNDVEGIETFYSLTEALNECDWDKDIWIIGGASLYQEGMEHAQEIDLTLVPDWIEEKEYKQVVRFPWVNPNIFEIKNITTSFGEENLTHITYKLVMREGV